MSLLTSNFRKPTLPQAVLLGLILFCATIDSSRQLSIGGVSGLGAATLAAGGVVWAVWMLRPVLPPGLLGLLLPLILFLVDALGTLFWYRPGMDGVQLAVIYLSFLGVLMLAARETAANPDLAPRLFRTMLISSCLPVLAWTVLILSGKISGEDLNLTRPFALYTLIIVAVALATWLGNNRPSRPRQPRQPVKPKTFLPLIWVVLIAYVVLLGLSRTALVTILLMLPLSIGLRGNRKSAALAVLILAIGAGLFSTLLFMNQGLYNRFFHEDAHMNVGGVSINSSGRTQIWNLLLDSIGDDKLYGKGISSSEELVSHHFIGISQPHNDYIRFYYDQGIIGLVLWLIFLAGFVYRTIGNFRRSIRDRTNDYPMHLAALLAITGVAISMFTDNSACYTFVMLPMAIVMGCSLGTGRAGLKNSAGLGFEVIRYPQAS